MSQYNPDRWVVLKIEPVDNSPHHYRVFGTWGGSYLGGQSWKMNSGIESVQFVDSCFEFIGSSGSLYRCHKNAYGCFSYGMSILDNFMKNDSYVKITIMNKNTDWLSLDYKGN